MVYDWDDADVLLMVQAADYFAENPSKTGLFQALMLYWAVGCGFMDLLELKQKCVRYSGLNFDSSISVKGKDGDGPSTLVKDLLSNNMQLLTMKYAEER